MERFLNMTRKIYLLRHAQAEGGFGTNDKERNLTDHGKQQAMQVGAILKSHDIETVLCSSATRTQQTLEGVKNGGTVFKKIEILDQLYNAPPDTLMNEVGKTQGTILVIAHNPGIHQLAFQLAESGDSALINQLTMGYAPATLSIFEDNKIIDLTFTS